MLENVVAGGVAGMIEDEKIEDEEKIENLEKTLADKKKVKELIEESDLPDETPVEEKVEISAGEKKDIKVAELLEESGDSVDNSADIKLIDDVVKTLDVAPAEPLNRNSTSFPLQLKSALMNIIVQSKNKDFGEDNDAFLRYYQLLTKHYFDWMTSTKITSVVAGVNYQPKGLLIAQVMGSGKTALSIVCAMTQIKTAKKIIVMLLKSLEENFVKNIKFVLSKYGMLDKDIDDLIAKKFKFVAFNASNMIKQLWRAAGENKDALVDLDIGELLLSAKSLDDTVVIVDEFHLLLRAITNGSKNGISFYNVVMKTPNVKVLGLTGSMISNDPFEFAICYNIMAGYPIFPENYLDFRRIFCDPIGRLRPEVRSKFQNRIVGLTSYIGLEDIKNSNEEEHKEDFTPKMKDDIIIKVEMTDYQTGMYLAYREKEAKELSFGSSGNLPNLQKPKSESVGTYKQKSRQLSNFAPPAGKVTEDNASSPKFKAILEKINELPGTHIVYSQYTSMGGLGAFSLFLNANGFERWSVAGSADSDDKKDEYAGEKEEKDESAGENKEKKEKIHSAGKYALFTGEESAELRSAALKDFNDSANIDGEKIKILMISSAGALGVDTNNCRYVHVMEPYWTEDRLIQVRARALRLNSAKDLPADQRFVQTYIYIAYPAKVGNGEYSHLGAEFLTASTDEEVFNHAKEGYEAIKTWIEAAKESSIECPVLAELWNDDRVCKMCAPSNQPLFTRDLMADIQSADSCMPYSKGEVDVNSLFVDFDGKQIELFYEFVPAGMNGYVMDLGLGAHRQLKPNEKLYKLLEDAVNKNNPLTAKAVYEKEKNN